MFANSLALIDDCDIVFGHIFPYSARAGTPAARMPQVDLATIRTRAKRMREAAARRQATWHKAMVGSVQNILVERGGAGHAENFARVALPGATDDLIGHVVRARIGLDNGIMTGTRL